MKTAKLIIFNIVFFLMIAGAAAGNPVDVMMGARPIGMGGAFVALSDDTNSALNNPAGLSQVRDMTISSMSSKFLGLVDYKMFAGTIPLEVGTLGIGVITSNTPAGSSSVRLVQGEDVIVQTGEEIFFFENVYSLSYGLNLSDDLLFGIGGKAYTRGFSGGAGDSAASYTIDAGLILKPEGPFSIGLSLNNITREKLEWGTSYEDPLPHSAKVGIAINAIGKTGIYSFDENELILCADAELRPENHVPFLAHYGIEFKPIPTLALRAGIEEKDGATSNLTAGAGFNLSGFGFDYAYRSDSDQPEAGMQYFSISYKFE
jgi:hypothetical protein